MELEPKTTIRGMLSKGQIKVPSYQRAYSWDIPNPDSRKKSQVDVFLKDIEDHINSGTSSPYYLGHFLFERGSEKGVFYVVDGQQRLTTTVILLSVIFDKLEKLKKSGLLNDNEREEIEMLKEDTVKRRSIYRFETVDYDDTFFKDYVIDKKGKNKSVILTSSQQRIANAFEFFKRKLPENKEYLLKLLKTLTEAVCTTHVVDDKPEAIQCFIYQNDRGKPPTELEILKAKFEHIALLFGKEDSGSLVKELESRFRNIYQNIVKIDDVLDEDEVLGYVKRMYFNTLYDVDAKERFEKKLKTKETRSLISFVKNFSRALEDSFLYLVNFFDKRTLETQSLNALGNPPIVFPFILKAYRLGLEKDLSDLITSFESLIIRHKIIGTRADLRSRLNDVFNSFSQKTGTRPILDRIDSLKEGKKSWWWNYWSDENFKSALKDGYVPLSVAKYILWKYENHLREEKGYKALPLTSEFEVEHIAPREKPNVPNHGYGRYTESFIESIEKIGNLVLISKSHNSSIGNKPLSKKLKTYDYLLQQIEVKKMIDKVKKNTGRAIWNRELIEERTKRLKRFILQNF